MIIPHRFESKQESKLALSWLDENNDALLAKLSEIEDRLNAQGVIVSEQNTIILQLNEAIKKLEPKAPEAKKTWWNKY